MGRSVDIYLGNERSDGSMDIVRPAELVAGPSEPGIQTEPALKLDDDLARALLDALAAHYGGTSDTRQLRRDYEAERARVDRLLELLALPVVTRGVS